MPYTKPLKARSGAAMQYDSGDYPASQAMVLEAAQWDDFPQRQAISDVSIAYCAVEIPAISASPNPVNVAFVILHVAP